MKVYGQAERMQVENLSADPSPGIKGRVWFNTSAGQIRYDDGSAVQIIGTLAASADSVAFAMTTTGTGYIAATMDGSDADTIALKMTTTGTAEIAATMLSANADTIAAKISSTGTGSIVATATTANANTLGAKITTAADTIAAQITATGTGSIVSTATAANANTLVNKLSAPNATISNLIGSAMTSSGAQAVVTTAEAASTFTATLVGCTGVITGTVEAYKIGKMVTLSFPSFSGTSNTTALTVTGVPSGFWPTSSSQLVLIRILNGAGATNLGIFKIDTDGTVTILADAGGGTWSNSGTKGILGNSITYCIAG